MIPAGVLADLQAQIDNALPDTVTIARTGAVVPCRVSADTDKRGIAVPGIPTAVHFVRWNLTLKTGTDVVVGDMLTVTGKGVYTAMFVKNPMSYTAAITAYCIALGTPLIASTIRPPAALNPGQVAASATHLSALSIYPLAGATFVPASPQFTADAFGVQLQQPAVLFAGWPAGDTSQQPVQPNDIVVMPDGSEYVVAGVQAWHNWRLAITVEMAVI